MSIEFSGEIKDLAKALSVAQGMMSHAVKDATNPHFGKTYADLASVLDVAREPLAKNGLALTQQPQADDRTVHLTTVLMHESGQWIKSTLSMVSKDSSSQALGSCITYARRYAASAVLGIAPDDDDGEKSMGERKEQKQGNQKPAQNQQPRQPLTQTPKVPTLYDKADLRMQKALSALLVKKQLPITMHDDVGEALHQLPFNDFEITKIIDSLRGQNAERQNP